MTANALPLCGKVIDVGGLVEADDVIVKSSIEAEMQSNSLTTGQGHCSLTDPVVMSVIRKHPR